MLHRIFGIIGWIGTALVFGAVAVRFIRPEWDQYAVYAAWGGLACVVIYTLAQWRDIAAFFKGRNARYGAIASVSVLVVLGILGIVNYLSQERFNKRWDLTANQQYSLSEQTIKLLQNLDAPVTFRVFDQDQNLERYRPRLTEYEYQSNRVNVEYIDMDQQPARARDAKIDTYGTVLVEYKDRTERVTTDSEQDLTNGLIKVITGQQKKVYFVQGHGEKDTADSERVGYSTISEALGRDNYGVEKLVLAQQKEVPADASVVVIGGPRSDLLQQEADMLRRYLEKGGHLLVLLDPPEPKGAPMPVLDGLLKEWSVDAGNNVVIDASGVGQIFGGDASVPVAATYAQHAITDRFNLLTAYPLARSVAPATAATEGRVAQTIISTSPRSWAETNLAASGEVALNPEAGDKPGPVSIGVAVTAPAKTEPPPATPAANTTQGEQPPKPETRMAVIGDSDFVANYALGIQGNRDLFMNAINWLAQQENLIAIRPRQADDRRITLTASRTVSLFWMSIFIIPAAVFLTGVYTWWRRR
ncbi:MAG TPA: Gldg family protein [Vicinamibacterales bacterium]